MRDSLEVIGELLNVIPDVNDQLKYKLKRIQNECMYTAPELQAVVLDSIQEALEDHIDVTKRPNEEWKFQVLSIFSMKPVSYLKDVWDRRESQK
jgi:hypothetical protein